MVAEPGAQYQITLPAYSPRTLQEAASAYFVPELYWLGIKGAKPSDLNFLVRAFLTDYNKEITRHTIDLYQKKSVDTVNAIVARLENSYPSTKSTYFNKLKKYSYGEIEYSVNQPDKEHVAQKYFDKTNFLLYQDGLTFLADFKKENNGR